MDSDDDDIVKAMERGDFRPLADWIRDRQAFGLRSERAARAARKIAPKEPTANDRKLAQAVTYYRELEANADRESALKTAAEKFGFTESVLWNAVDHKRPGVNQILRGQI